VSRFLGAAFLLYFAWRIARAGGAEAAAPSAPFRFHEAALFQLINPKGWLYAISSATAFLSSEGLRAVAVLTTTAASVTVISTLTWTCFGTVLARLITSPARRQRVNWLFAASLIALIPLIVGDPT
jgi:threonine/homoserine/homoserine lactone efflux protein